MVRPRPRNAERWRFSLTLPMCSLHEILAHGTGLPASLMAQRRAAMAVAVDRFWGDTYAPMPSVDAVPGVYRPTPTDQMDPDLARMERARNAADSARSGRFVKRQAA